jgi:orotate phosphoribosyltransferase
MHFTGLLFPSQICYTYLMDETTSTIIERITIKSDKPMRLPNGEHSDVFYDCIQLTPNDLARLAAEAVGELDENSFDMAVAVAYSGILFSAAVAGGKQVAILDHQNKIQGPDVVNKRVIVVDDVIHHANRINKSIDLISKMGAKVVAVAAIIDRLDVNRTNLSIPLYSAFQVE